MMNTIITSLGLNRSIYRTGMAVLLLLAGLLSFSTHTHTAFAADTCAPYSPYSCATVKVTPAPAYCLNFNSGVGGIPDKSGLGTGFTMIDPNTAPLNDQPSGNPSALSYVDDLVNLSGGQLKLTATKGLTYGRNGVSGVTQSNSLVNGLGVGFTPQGTFEVSARMINLDFIDTPAINASQQAGIWFGIDEDNYAKLAIYKVDENVGRLQFVVETYNGSTLNLQDFRPEELFVDLNTLTFDLVLEINASTLTANARYRVNDGEWVTLSRTSTLTSAFVTGKTLPNAGGNASFAGIIASKRSAPEIEKMTVNFDDFCLTRTGNIEPLAVVDSYNTSEDQALSVNAADGVLKNDSDPNPEDTLTAAIVSAPSHAASFSLSANGSFNYTPAANYSGADSFTYRANDGAMNSSLTTVSITVAPVNDPPTAQNAGFNVNEDGTLNIKVANGLATKIGDIDTPAHLLSVVLVTPPAKGSIALNPTGSFTYMPMAHFNGADSFTYMAYDGALNSGTATVNITVNPQPDTPDAIDDAYTGHQNTSIVVNAVLGVLHNDSNPDGGAFVASVQTAPLHGDLSLSANGSFTYSPDTDYLGADSFVYTATGGAGSDTATVHLDITLAPAELAVNGGFETPDAGNGKVPGDWTGKRLTQDLLRCASSGNYARNGDCAFEFKGKQGENSSLEQQIAGLGMIEGDTLVMSAMVKGQGVVGKAGRINVQVTFDDNKKKTYSLIVPRSTYDYRRYTKTFVLPRSVDDIKISLTYKGVKGKWWADDISVKHYATGDADLAITSRQDGVSGRIIVPDAPPGMRGN